MLRLLLAYKLVCAKHTSCLISTHTSLQYCCVSRSRKLVVSNSKLLAPRTRDMMTCSTLTWRRPEERTAGVHWIRRDCRQSAEEVPTPATGGTGGRPPHQREQEELLHQTTAAGSLDWPRVVIAELAVLGNRAIPLKAARRKPKYERQLCYSPVVRASQSAVGGVPQPLFEPPDSFGRVRRLP